MKKHLQFTLSCIALFFVSFAALGQNALSFDGSNDYVQTTYGGVTGNTDRTFEAWIKLSPNATGNNCIFDYGTNSVGARNTFVVSGTKQLGYLSGGTNANTFSSANDVPVDVWTHVAIVINNGIGYLYVNGLQVGTGSLTSVNTPAGNINLRIGERVSGGSIPFQGEIDEVRVWNVARSASQIQETMNRDFCVVPTTLQAYYKFNQGVANGANAAITTLTDYSANANSGNLLNFGLTGTSSNWVAGVAISSNIYGNASASVAACVPYNTAGNQTLTTSGAYIDTITLVTGCDSTYFLSFTALDASSSIIDTMVCDTYTAPSGITYSTSGTYTDIIQNVNGCDSTITINLTVSSSSQSTLTASACNTYTSPSGKIFTASGNYMDTIPSLIVCDSIISIDLVIYNTTSSSLSATACLSYESPLGNIYTTSGIYNDTLQNSVGCDSVLIINLTISNSTLIDQTETTCNSFMSPSGKTWATTGIYQDTVFGGASCATIYTIDLTVNYDDSATIIENACESFTSDLGNTYTESGVYTEMTQTVNGCDSTITLDLTVISIDTTVSQSGFTLTATEPGATYQWINCADQTEIAGANSQTFTPIVSGSYAVEIEHENCTRRSACYDIFNVGIDAIENNVVSIYPNPTFGQITMELDNNYEKIWVQVINTDGKMMKSIELSNTNKLEFDLPLANGLYTILVYTNGKLNAYKVLKMD